MRKNKTIGSNMGRDKLFLMIIIGIFMAISLVSAADYKFDNTKVYNESSETITIWDKGFLFIGEDTKLAEAKLNTPKIYNVIRGKDRLVAEFELESYWVDYNSLEKMIDNWRFYDISRSPREIEKTITLKKKAISYNNVTDYIDNCVDSGQKNVNGTAIMTCIPKANGSHLVPVVTWNAIDKKAILDKRATIGVFTDVEAGEQTEWYFDLVGFQTTEWAEWNETFSQGLQLYYNMSDTQEDVNTAQTVWNITSNERAPQINTTVTGIIGTALNLSANTQGGKIVNQSGNSIPCITTYCNLTTISFWYYTGNLSSYRRIIGGGNCYLPTGYLIQTYTQSGSQIYTTFHGSSTIFTGLLTEQWYLITITTNETGGASYYINGTYFAGSTVDYPSNSTCGSLYLGEYGASQSSNGRMDELSIWNRTLSASEIEGLYNGGAGITYGEGGTPPAPTGTFNVTLIEPLNETKFNTNVNDFFFNITQFQDINLTNFTLYVWNSSDDIVIQHEDTNFATDTDCTNYWDEGRNTTYIECIGQDISIEDDYRWDVYACGENSTGDSMNCSYSWNGNYSFSIDKTPPYVTIAYPLETNYSSGADDLNFTVIDIHNDTCIYSVDDWVSETPSNSNVTGLTPTELYNTYSIWCNDTYGNTNITNVTFFYDSIYPKINFTTPSTSAGNTTQTYIEMNITVDEANFKNLTLLLMNGSMDIINETTVTSTDLYLNYSGLADGNYNINATACDIVSNCNSTETRAITIDTLPPLITIGIPQSDIYSQKNISLNYTLTETNPDSCWYSINGEANVTLTDCGNDTILLNTRNNTLVVYANDSIGNVNSTTAYPYYLPQLAICNDSNTFVYVNYTFKNETIGTEDVDASLISSWTYWFDESAVGTLSLVNTTDNPSYAFCIDGDNQTLYAQPSFQYYNSYSYVRDYYEDFSLTNTTTSRTLFLLPSGLGQYVTFSIVDGASQPVPQAQMNISLLTGEVIESKLSDDLGVIITYLNPVTVYHFYTLKEGLGSSYLTFAPINTEYTITLGGVQSPVNVTTYSSEGVTLTIAPSISYLENNTDYTFNMTINASEDNLDGFGINIGDGTTIFAVDSDTSSSGGIVSITLNTVTNTTFVMKYYYIVDGEEQNFTKIYYIYDSSGSDWSILNLFEDIKTYSDGGIFGLTQFGLTIIIFLIIFLITGIMSYKFGLSSPAMIIGIVFFLVLIFDVVFGMISNPIGAIPHFLTVLIGLILVGLFFKEVTE